MGIFLTVSLEIFNIHPLFTEEKPDAILVFIIFDAVHKFSRIFFSRPLSFLTCMNRSHLWRDGLPSPSNTDWDRFPALMEYQD
jgi:hypothetical protein